MAEERGVALNNVKSSAVNSTHTRRVRYQRAAMGANGTKAARVAEAQRFKDSVAVVITFWLDMGRTTEKRNAMVDKMLKIFFTTHPEYAPLFADGDGGPQMMNRMFNALVNVLAVPNLEDALELLEELGKRHRDLRIPAASYDHFLSSFEKALHEFFPHLFTTRTQFCFAAVINFLSSKMIEAGEIEDVRHKESIFEPRYPVGHFDGLDVNNWVSFSSNDLCLQYLHLHSVMLLSSELTLFLRDALEYRKSPTVEKYEEIFNTYIAEDGPSAINLNKETRSRISNRYKAEGIVPSIFDDTVKEMGLLIQRNTHLWDDFKTSKLWDEMIANISFHKKHAKKLKRSAAKIRESVDAASLKDDRTTTTKSLSCGRANSRREVQVESSGSSSSEAKALSSEASSIGSSDFSFNRDRFAGASTRSTWARLGMSPRVFSHAPPLDPHKARRKSLGGVSPVNAAKPKSPSSNVAPF